MEHSKLFKPTYTTRDGKKKQAARWYLAVSGTRKSIALYKDKRTSKEAEKHIDRLSAARYAGRNAIGVIMTGMGDDGARHFPSSVPGPVGLGANRGNRR